MNIAGYLERIAYQGPVTPTAETLRRLQVAHLMSVPFENLSIDAGEPIVLEDEALFEKIVTRRRGGFCYELNGLFAWLLGSLGFRVVMLSAEVMSARGDWGPLFDHMTLVVSLEDRWLVDVGFGDSFVEPLRLEPGREQPQGLHSYRIDLADGRFVLMRRHREGPWTAQYRFDLTRYEYADYHPMCRYHQTSPESHFTRSRVCSLARPEGRITISGTRLIRTVDGERQESELSSETEYLNALRTHFGIALESERSAGHRVRRSSASSQSTT